MVCFSFIESRPRSNRLLEHLPNGKSAAKLVCKHYEIRLAQYHCSIAAFHASFVLARLFLAGLKPAIFLAQKIP
jgi:hypothetical protein